MIYVWIIYILFFISVGILLLALRIHFFNRSIPRGDTTLEDFLRDVNTGDLLFFSGTTFSEKSIKWCHNSYWNHCSIVLRDVDTSTGKDTPFIFESDLGQGYKDGPRVMRLEDKLKRWKGDKTLGWRRYILGSDVKAMKDMILEIATKCYREGYGFDNTFYSWFLSRLYPVKKGQDLGKKYQKKVFCSELVAFVLQRSGVLTEERPPCWYTPEYLFTLTGTVYGFPFYVGF